MFNKINLLLIPCLFVILFAWQPNTITAQSYIEGLGTAEYDTLNKEIQRALDATKYDTAVILTENFHAYWKKRLDQEKTQPVIQNYYYSYIQKIRPKLKTQNISDQELQSYFALENKIATDIGDARDLLPLYFSVAAALKTVIEKDPEASIIFSDKYITIKNSADTIDYPGIAKEMVTRGYSLANLTRYDEAISCQEESLRLKRKYSPGDTLELIYGYYALGLVNFKAKDFEESLKQFEFGYELARKTLPLTHKLHVTLIRATGVLHSELGNLNKALNRSLIGLKAAKLRSSNSTYSLSLHYEGIATINSHLGFLKEANLYADTAISIIEESDSNKRLAIQYLNKATITSNINEQIRLSKKALQICPDDSECRQSDINGLLNNLGDSYARKGNLKMGLDYLLKSKDLKESDYKEFGQNLPTTYRAIANIYRQENDIEKAIEYQKKALAAVKDFRPDTSYYVAIESSNLGAMYLDANQIELAEPILLESKLILEQKLGKFNKNLNYNYNSLSKIYTHKKEYSNAIQYGYKALNNITEQNANVYESATNPLLQLATIYGIRNQIDSAEIMVEKLLSINGFSPFENEKANRSEIPLNQQWFSYNALVRSTYLLDKLTDGNQKHLLSKIKTAVKLIDKLRQYYFFEKSEVEFQNNTKEFFDWSIRKLTELNSTSNKQQITALIFECIEKSKSISINRNFVRHEASTNESVPDHILKREKSLIIAYENEYEKYEKSVHNDSLSKIHINKMYVLQTSKEGFLDSLKIAYPDYYSSRYDQHTIDLKTIEDYAKKDNRSFIINHWTDSLIYQFIITPRLTNFSSIVTSDLNPHIDNVLSTVSIPSHSQSEADFYNTKSTFINSAVTLYEYLFSNDKVIPLSFDLTLISSGKLTQFPFDVLLTEKTQTEASYKSMPYLIKSHSINYLGSATQYVQLSNNKSYKSSDDYLGFAPSYSGKSITNDSLNQFRSTFSFNPLLYNFEEISKTRSLFSGEEYIGNDATVKAFRENVDLSNILHLAMHTKIDDRFPLDSYLSFAIDSTLEDSRLYAHEIAKMNLNQNLVVLSACETNKGDQTKGEGILGIARAFQIATCPNLIVSNWVVDDRSAGEIIYSFFEGIKGEINPAHSLRNAKLNFIENSSVIKSHPFYWAGFAYHGNSTLNAKSPALRKLLLIGSLVLLLALSFLILRRRRGRSR